MGIFDFVKQGTADALLARPSSSRDPIHAHAGAILPLYGQLEVAADECAVFVRDGRAIGLVGPGHHGLHPSKLPFLEGLVDASGTIDARLVFVKFVLVERARFQAAIGEPAPSEARFEGALRVEVVDPAALVEDWLADPHRSLFARPGVVASIDGARVVVDGRRVVVFAGPRLQPHASTAPARPAKAEADQAAKTACRACGTEGDVGSFCEGCGALVDALERCVACRTELRAGARFCAGCGVRVRE